MQRDCSVWGFLKHIGYVSDLVPQIKKTWVGNEKKNQDMSCSDYREQI